MTRPSRSSLIAVLVVALLAVADAAWAIVWCQRWFPFSVINVNQIARFSAVLTHPPVEKISCPTSLTFPLTLTFFNREGRIVGTPDDRTLVHGAIVSADFVSDPNIRRGQRMDIQAEGEVGDPKQRPESPCRVQVLFSVQVLNKGTMKTEYIMTDKVVLDIAGRQ